MRKHHTYTTCISLIITLCFLMVGCLPSCTSTKGAVYFENTSNTEFLNSQQKFEPIIQENDLLSITISSLNPAATEIFNVLNIDSDRSLTASNTTSQAVGYLVDQDGNIQFPFLGKVKAAGLTKKSLNQHIRKELINRKLLVDPIVDIRFLNYKVSVLGEVAKPSVFTIPNEKITFLEAIGLAGDLTIYANRKNVLLIREEEGKKKLTRINLTTDELFKSPYYYLKPNDIIYVEPNKAKIASTSSTRQWLPIIFSGLTVVVVALDRLTR